MWYNEKMKITNHLILLFITLFSTFKIDMTVPKIEPGTSAPKTEYTSDLVLYSPELKVIPNYHTEVIIKIPVIVSPFIWPIDSRIISQQYWLFHTAIDIITPMYTEVHAMADGTVTYSGWKDGGYGYFIIIDHANGFQSWYEHNSELLVNVGDKVKQGQLISYSGNTGHSTGPHLHLEIRKEGVPINPLWYLPR